MSDLSAVFLGLHGAGYAGSVTAPSTLHQSKVLSLIGIKPLTASKNSWMDPEFNSHAGGSAEVTSEGLLWTSVRGISVKNVNSCYTSPICTCKKFWKSSFVFFSPHIMCYFMLSSQEISVKYLYVCENGSKLCRVKTAQTLSWTPVKTLTRVRTGNPGLDWDEADSQNRPSL